MVAVVAVDSGGGVRTARGGEWHSGSSRSGDGDRFWVRRKCSPEKVFRRRRRWWVTGGGGGWPAGGQAAGESDGVAAMGCEGDGDVGCRWCGGCGVAAAVVGVG
nr:hypothetical protein [Tanacetum cinerariifolium]